MAFEVPEAQRSIDQNKFKFKVGSKSFTVPKLKYLDGYEMEMVNSGEDEKVYLVFGPEGSAIYKAVKSLEVETQFKPLVDAWVADSEMTPGESEAS